MAISFASLASCDTGILRVLAMFLRQRPSGMVRYDNPGREDHMLHYHLSGTRVYQIPGQEDLCLNPGDIFLLPWGARYATFAKGPEDALGYNVRFSLMNASGEPLDLSDGPQLLLNDVSGRLLTYFQDLARLSVQTDSVMASKAKTATLLQEIIQATAAKETHWLSLATAYMGAHLQGPLSLKELTQVCHMSERTFCRRFKEATGFAPIAWHRRMRVMKAKEFLETTCCTLETAAEALGFSDAAHLSRCLFRETGEHAGELRKKA